MKNLIAVLIACLLSVPTTFVSAQQGPKTNDKKTRFLLQKMKEDIWSESLNRIVRDYQLAGTPGRLDSLMMGHLRDSDRRFFRDSMRRVSRLPELSKDRLTMTFSTAGFKPVKLELIDLAEKRFRVNGKLWTYRPKESLKEQVMMLEQMVASRADGTSSLPSAVFRLLVPEADAVFWVPMIVGAVIGSVITSGIMDPAIRAASKWACDVTNESLEWDTTQYDLCVEWKKKKMEAGKSNRGRLDAIEKMIASDQKNVLGKFEVIGEKSCADNTDGKERVYSSDVEVKETRQRVHFEARFSPEGKAIDLKISELKTKKALATLQFDKENYMTCALLPNKAAETDALTSKELNSCFESVSTAEEKAKLSFLEDAARFVNLRVTRCNVQNAAETIAKGETVLSPLDATPASDADAKEDKNQK
ncbi:MAG TPA: hypothetical protein PL182_08240 [Pseudobdellovibrionaceae bacterium]|nr:hypothetical protein [Pseudobdellovibrionaceae bacterium]